MLKLLLLILAATAAQAAVFHEPTSDVRLSRATKEAARVIYELSGELAPAVPVGDARVLRAALARADPRGVHVVVAPYSRLAVLGPALAPATVAPVTEGAHFVRRTTLAGRTLIVCAGVDELATL